MAGFLGKIFGFKKKEHNSVESLVRFTLTELLDKSGLDLSFDLDFSSGVPDKHNIAIELFGPDEDSMKDNEGQLIDSIQLFIQRVVQHNFPEDNSKISIDSGGFREESNQALVDLAEKLKGIALEKGKSVYFRALPPKDRKIIHQYLANDTRVKSRSIGDGLFKKIKIYPIRGSNNSNESIHEDDEKSSSVE